MDLHPLPAPGQAKPWAFPVPRARRARQRADRAALPPARPAGRGRGDLPGHAAGRRARRARRDRHDHGARAVRGQPASTPPRSSPPSWSAAARRSARTSTTPARASRWRFPLPACRRALGLLAEALRAPAFAGSEVERLVRNRLDEIPHELANPGRRAAKQLSQELFPASSRMSRPRQGTEETVARIDAAGVRAFYQAQVRPAAATAVVVGDLTGIDLDAVLAEHARRMDRRRRRAAAGAAGDSRRHRPGGDRRPARRRPDAAAHRADRPGPARPGLAGAGPRHVLPGRHAHLAAGPGPAGGEGLHVRGTGLRAGAAVAGAAAARTARRAPSLLAISGSVDTASTGPALGDLWTVLRTLAAEGLTETPSATWRCRTWSASRR